MTNEGSQDEKIKSVSAGVFESDVDELNNLSSETEFSRSMLVRFAVRDFVQRFKSGKIELEADSERSLVNVKPSAQTAAETPPKKGKKPIGRGKSKKRQAQAKSGKGNKKKKGKK
jgi:hypothetical protein